jgi:high-affinity Fe2+/Pb2+ permease
MKAQAQSMEYWLWFILGAIAALMMLGIWYFNAAKPLGV